MGNQVTGAGGVLIEVLANNFSQPGGVPTKSDLDSWIQAYKLPISCVKDAPNAKVRTITALERRELAYIVNLKTMKIVERFDGTVTGIGDTTITKGFAIMLKLLGK